ncbi:MAG: FumA C-terminus/TtdB family hydratase beta subunit [Candidatus Sumerlaeia bacterium]|nr:FumA C-terminus/TtdB family hydratase beta subunit [Candidatus Sumerlaeia bacterium]
MIDLQLPASEKAVRRLNVGDRVAISGVIVTARDAAHHYLTHSDGREVSGSLRGGVIYHCGPVVARENGVWRFIAAGPTTSMREEVYEAEIIARYGVRGIIGKGGMGDKTLAACREYGCVYFDAIGGLAVVLAQCVKRVVAVYKLEEFGEPEAMWVIEVEKFPVTVGMDTHGRSIYAEIESRSAARRQELLTGKSA